jgi:hypothetical protein
MKRIFAFGLFGMATFALAGCPIYGDSSCYDSTDCPGSQYCGRDGQCHSGYSGEAGYGGGTLPVTCYEPGDCGANETCGADYTCHPGDCSYKATGCVAGYTCTSVSGSGYQCVADSDGGDDGATEGAAGGSDGGAEASGDASDEGTTSDASGDATSSVVYCGYPADCASDETCSADGTCHAGDCGSSPCINGFVCQSGSNGPTCVHGNPAACGSDLDCGGNGSLCVDGLCTATTSLCSDRTQCASGDECVDGKCIARCTTDVQCTDGFACHPTLGVCTNAVAACKSTQDCGSAKSVCIDNPCVPRCGAGGACQTGSVCVDNGCVPIAAPSVDCNVDGQQDACATGEICLHHHCYVSCEAPNDAACASQAVYTVCKQVTTASGAHSICGSAQNLGSECDATLGQACSPGKVCIDGFCRTP